MVITYLLVFQNQISRYSDRNPITLQYDMSRILTLVSDFSLSERSVTETLHAKVLGTECDSRKESGTCAFYRKYYGISLKSMITSNFIVLGLMVKKKLFFLRLFGSIVVLSL